MSWRIVVISKRAKLEQKLNYMVVRGDDTVRIHLSEIAVLVIESTAVSLTTALLCELVKRKVKVIFCDEKRNPSSELVPSYGSHDTSGKIRMQIEWSDNIKGMVWTEIVAEKIRKQQGLLKKLHRDEAEMLGQYVTEIEYADRTNREGHAAKVYFNAIFGMEFTRSADDPINAALNYGYGIILSAFTREIVANGYITQIGLFHDNQFNPFKFASDLMEPFRTLIDAEVYDMKPEKLEREEKLRLVNCLNKNVVIAGKTQYVMNAVKIYCKSVFGALNEKDISLIKFYRDEL
ncbi:MAG: type II CRISPR-associated endonuclease Cas1 [Lachnospiraceae bacterium]|nr:type II CRISPR-associated endonuclease Cas1 [Lachnospiraceae bacterium]